MTVSGCYPGLVGLNKVCMHNFEFCFDVFELGKLTLSLWVGCHWLWSVVGLCVLSFVIAV